MHPSFFQKTNVVTGANCHTPNAMRSWIRTLIWLLRLSLLTDASSQSLKAPGFWPSAALDPSRDSSAFTPLL